MILIAFVAGMQYVATRTLFGRHVFTVGGSDLLLFAIAGPVIAGTSLFGGRGSVWSALLGAITIGSISNGMDLLALQSSVKFMVTGAVLVVAVVVDALARRNRQARAWRALTPGSPDRLSVKRDPSQRTGRTSPAWETPARDPPPGTT